MPELKTLSQVAMNLAVARTDTKERPLDNARLDCLIDSVEDTFKRLDAAISDAAISDLAISDSDRQVAPATTHPVLSVIIPVYNEEQTITRVIDKVLALPIQLEVIVVNDGSSDGTWDSLQSFAKPSSVRCFTHDVNQGKGAALRTGIARASGDIVIIQDADLEYDPSNIATLIQPLLDGVTDVVYGSRYLSHAQQDPSRIHRFGNWLLTAFSNMMSQQSLTDMETCYKAFRRELIQSIQIEENRFGFEPEITAKLGKCGAHIIEMPVTYHARGWHEGKKIGWRDLVRTLYCIIKYNLR